MSSQNSCSPKRLVGLTSATLLHQPASATGFGIYTMLYSDPRRPDQFLAPRYDDAGDMLGYVPLRRLRADQYVTVPDGACAPQIGSPYELGVVLDPRTPNDVRYGQWQRVATMLTGDMFPTIRDAIFRDPLAGYYVANFLSADVPKFISNGGTGFDLQPARYRLEQLALIKAALLSRHPEWTALGLRENERSQNWDVSN